MLTQEQDCACSTLAIRTDDRRSPNNEMLQRQGIEAEGHGTADVPLRLFEMTSPISFAERFPRLVFFAVAASILLAAITAEVDCLRGAGYYWP